MTAKQTERASGKRAKQKAETRARILEAALLAFAERGFDGASIRDIAADAGVYHGLIKYHFEDKDRLWKAAVDFLFERLHEEMKPLPEEAELSPYDRIRSWLRRYVQYCARHPEHARIMVQESIRDSDRLLWAVEHHIRKDHEDFRRQVPERVKAGIYPDLPDYLLAYIITAAAQMLFVLGAEVKHLYGVDVYDERVVDQHADAILKLFYEHRVPDDMCKET